MIETSLNTVNIFGTTLVSTTKHGVLKQAGEKIRKNHKFLLLTPNPEILLRARENRELQDILNGSDMKVMDGVGIKIAYRYLNDKISISWGFIRPFPETLSLIKNIFKVILENKNEEPFPIIKGRGFFVDLIKMCSRNKWKIFLLGGTEGVAKSVEEKLKKKYQNLKVESSSGPILDEHAIPVTKKGRKIEEKTIKKINSFKPDIVFVAFGAPKQELWSSRHLAKLNTKGMMVVGGTFDYISGKVKLPPKCMEKIGLEWLWRLITQPERIGRVLSATIIFPLYLFRQKIGKLG